MRIITYTGFGHHFTTTVNWYCVTPSLRGYRLVCLFCLCFFFRSYRIYNMCVNEKSNSGYIPLINNSFPQSYEISLILIKTRRAGFICLNGTQVLTFKIPLQLSDHRRLTVLLFFVCLWLYLSMLFQTLLFFTKLFCRFFQGSHRGCRLCIFLFRWCSVGVAHVYSRIKLIL